MKRSERKQVIHSYPWYPHDWFMSETRLAADLPARAIYRDLLDFNYEHGSIPADAKAQARICLCSIAEIEAAWPQICSNFAPQRNQPNRLCNTRAKLIRNSLQNLRKKQTERAQKRWKDKPNQENEMQATASRRHIPEECGGNAYPLPLPLPQPLPSTSAASAGFAPPLLGWQRFENSYPGLVTEMDCQLWLSIIETAEEEALLFRNLALWQASDQWRDVKYIPKAENFLSKRIYRKPPPMSRTEQPFSDIPAWKGLGERPVD